MAQFPLPPPAPRSNRRIYITVGAIAALVVVAVVVALVSSDDPPQAASLGASPSPSLSVCERFPGLRACGGEGYDTTTAAPYTPGPESNANEDANQGSGNTRCTDLDTAIAASHAGAGYVNDAGMAASNNDADRAATELRRAANEYKAISDAMAPWSKPVSRDAITVARLLSAAAGYITNGDLHSAAQTLNLAAVSLGELSDEVKRLPGIGMFAGC
jgi:hypothetical protein